MDTKFLHLTFKTENQLPIMGVLEILAQQADLLCGFWKKTWLFHKKLWE